MAVVSARGGGAVGLDGGKVLLADLLGWKGWDIQEKTFYGFGGHSYIVGKA